MRDTRLPGKAKSGLSLNTAFLVLTHRCTRACAYCFYTTGHIRKGGGELGAEKWIGVIRELSGMGVSNQILTGGEPLLRGDLELLVREASGTGSFPLLLTNGDLLDGGRIDSLSKAGLRALSLHADRFDGEEEDRVGSLLYRLQEKGISATLIGVVTLENWSRAGRIVRFCRDRGVGLILQPAFVPEGHPAFERLSLKNLSEGELAILAKDLGEWGREHAALPYAELFLSCVSGGSLRPRICSMGREAAVVHSDGSVFACFHRPDLSAGNVLEEDPAALLAKVEALSDKVRTAPCFGEHCVSLFLSATDLKNAQPKT